MKWRRNGPARSDRESREGGADCVVIRLRSGVEIDDTASNGNGGGDSRGARAAGLTSPFSGTALSPDRSGRLTLPSFRVDPP